MKTKIKRILSIALVLFMSVLPLTIMFNMGCNQSMGLGNFTFNKIHILTYSDQGFCVEIEKWHDNETGIEVKMKEGGSLYLSEGAYILVSDKCPICGK